MVLKEEVKYTDMNDTSKLECNLTNSLLVIAVTEPEFKHTLCTWSKVVFFDRISNKKHLRHLVYEQSIDEKEILEILKKTFPRIEILRAQQMDNIHVFEGGNQDQVSSSDMIGTYWKDGSIFILEGGNNYVLFASDNVFNKNMEINRLKDFFKNDEELLVEDYGSCWILM
jgi:hypothetical protein